MKLLKELNEATKTLPQKFNSGDEFMDFVYDKWPSKDTHVEHQGGGAWSAEIGGDNKIKAATYDEEDHVVSWLDADHEELNEAREKPKVKRNMRITVMGKPTTITGVGADYIKVKYDHDKSPHGDSDVIWFSDFDKHNVDLSNPDDK